MGIPSKAMKELMLLFSVQMLLCSSSALVRQDLPPDTYPLAICNDGTHANYYHQPTEPHGKYHINLQGGGKCDSIASCHDRCNKTDLCTAQTDEQLGEAVGF